MKSPILTTRELAGYLKLNEKTIIKKAQIGEIPGVKVGSQWRFDLAVINAYVKGHGVKPQSDDISKDLTDTPHEIIPLSRLVDEASISLSLRASARDEILHELAAIAKKAGIARTVRGLFKELRAREDMLSTAIGNGVAIPHPRYPDGSLFKRLSLVIACSKKGVDFCAPSGRKVHLFFMTCAPNMIAHLRLLANIARLLHTRRVVDRFVTAESKKEIMRLLMEFDKKHFFSEDRDRIWHRA